MDLLVMDKNFVAVSIIDQYKSLIWTDRFRGYGDFELYLPMNYELLKTLRKDHYLWINDSEHVMIIDTLRIATDVDEGAMLTVTGKSLEKILDRRIVWEQTDFQNVPLETAVETLLNENFIDPVDPDRRVENFVFQPSGDSAIEELQVTSQYVGDEVYDAVLEQCNTNGIGFRITLDDRDCFVFSLYAGTDRSYGQTENPYVIFSPNFDNIISSEYLETNENLKTATLVAGEEYGSTRKYATAGGGTGLERREVYTDATSLQSQNEDHIWSKAQYLEALAGQGRAKLAECCSETAFEGQAETTRMFKYGEDFFVGDIVQVEDAYGHEGRARITEIIFSYDEEGLSVYPTFESVTEKEVESE